MKTCCDGGWGGGEKCFDYSILYGLLLLFVVCCLLFVVCCLLFVVVC